jgi:hypothetical protein
MVSATSKKRKIYHRMISSSDPLPTYMFLDACHVFANDVTVNDIIN